VRTSINFQSYPLETKFAQAALATGSKISKKVKGLFRITWLKRYRELVLFDLS